LAARVRRRPVCATGRLFVAVFPLSARPLMFVAGIGARINIRLKAVALIQVE
jgi:hypothetical protein